MMKKNYTISFLQNGITRRVLMGMALVFGMQEISSAQTYCTPSYGSGCTYGDDIDDFTLNGANGTMINNLNTPCPSSGYENYTTSTAPDMSCDLILGQTYTGTVSTNYSCCEDVRAWIDYNQNGTFEASEQLFTPIIGMGSGTPGSFSITIPNTASVGATRLRVRVGYYGGASMDPCNNLSYGECHDYKVNIQPLAPPDNAGVDSLVNPPLNGAFCSGTQDVTVRVRNLGINLITSVQVNWSINGVLQAPVAYNMPIDSIYSPTTNMAFVTLGTAEFPYNTPVSIKAWTTMPNGVPDNDTTDDAMLVDVTSNMQGVDIALTPEDTTICSGDEFIIDAGSFEGSPIYIWSTGALTQTISITEPGMYYVKVQSATGCFDYDTMYVAVHPDPVANSVAIIDNGNNNFTFNIIGAQNVDNYLWDFGDGSATETGPGPKTHTYTQQGQFTATVTLSNQCGEKILTRLIATTTTGIDNLEGLQKELKIFPNPGKETITISHYGNLKLKSVEIYNLLGQKVYSSAVNADKHVMDVSGFASGMYNVIIDTNKGKAAKKLEVIK